MGWFHLFSKIKVVSNNFLSEQTVGRLIILVMVVNRVFFFCSTQVVLAACCCSGVSRAAGTYQAQSQPPLRQTLGFQGWAGKGVVRKVPSELNTKAAWRRWYVLNQNWSSFLPKHLIICICRTKSGYGASAGNTSKVSKFGMCISHSGCQRKCLPGPLQHVFQRCWQGWPSLPGNLFTFHRNMFLFKLHVAVLQNPMILGQNSTASLKFEPTAKMVGKSNALCKLGHGTQYFHSCWKHLGKLYFCLYLKKAACNQGLQSPHVNCNYELTQTIFSSQFSHTHYVRYTDECWSAQPKSGVTQSSCKRHLEKDELYCSYSYYV